MGAKEFIKGIINRIRKPKQNLLTGDIDPNFNKTHAFKEGLKHKEPISTVEEKETIEDCILEYIEQYIKQVEIGTKHEISYKAITRMFSGGKEEIGKNAEFQQKLKDKIHKSSQYRIDGQYSSNGKPIFYHISQNTPEGQKITDHDANLYKIYLNCERKDIAKLSGELLKKINGIDQCAFRIKFMAESDDIEISKHYQRNDKIVIYTPNEIDKERIISSITDLKSEKPELFSNKKKLPLMPKVNGFIGCIKQGHNIVSTPLYKAKYADTYNDKLAKIMEDCMVSSLREISARDAKLVYAIDGYYGEDAKEYLKTFNLMTPGQIQDVVEMFKLQLSQSCKESNLDIDLEEETPNQQR